jgi:hypothetical protein
MGLVLRLVVAAVIVVGIAAIGLWVLGAITAGRPRERIEPEDVAELDVYFVCVECGTELQVTRLGETQVPRHCGEPMRVERRPHKKQLAT